MRTDPTFQTTSAADLDTMLDANRYRNRSRCFEQIVARSEEHFWDPADPDYISFREAAPPGVPLLPFDFVIESGTAVWDRLDGSQRLAFANDSARWIVSNLLHCEQGALSLAAGLCQILVDPGSQECAANQVREEARHVHAFTLYAESRFDGQIFAVTEPVGDLLHHLIDTPQINRKILGTHMLVEGLALGMFATLQRVALDPVLKRLCRLVIADEAFHHHFGKVWAFKTIPSLTEQERDAVEDWAEEWFQVFFSNLVCPDQKEALYARYGLECNWVRGAIEEAVGATGGESLMRRYAGPARLVINTLSDAGVITERTRSTYSPWVDVIAQDDVEEETAHLADALLSELRQINADKRRLLKASRRGSRGVAPTMP